MNKWILTLPLLMLVATSVHAAEPPSAELPSNPAPSPVAEPPQALVVPQPAPKATVPASAPETDSFDSPLQSAEGRQALATIGKSYRHFAASLGCGRFAWGTISQDGSQFTLKYLPPGTSMADWKKMVVITVYALTGDQAISQIISQTEGQYIKLAHVTNDQNYPALNNEHTMFLQYTLGQIDAAAVCIRTGSSSASLIQLQERGATISKEDVLKVNKLANPRAGQAPPTAAKQK